MGYRSSVIWRLSLSNRIPKFRSNVVSSSSRVETAKKKFRHFDTWRWGQYVASKRPNPYTCNVVSYPRRKESSATPLRNDENSDKNLFVDFIHYKAVGLEINPQPHREPSRLEVRQLIVLQSALWLPCRRCLISLGINSTRLQVIHCPQHHRVTSMILFHVQKHFLWKCVHDIRILK